VQKLIPVSNQSYALSALGYASAAENDKGRAGAPAVLVAAGLADKLDAEHFAAAPCDLAPLTCERMRYGRKPQPISDCDVDLSDELRAVQRHIQDLALVADKVVVEHDPRGVLPRSSRFAFVLCNKHQDALAW